MLQLLICTVLLFHVLCVNASTEKKDTKTLFVKETNKDIVHDGIPATEITLDNTLALNSTEKKPAPKRKRKSAEKTNDTKTTTTTSVSQEAPLKIMQLPQSFHYLLWTYLSVTDERQYLRTHSILYALLCPLYRAEVAFFVRQYFAWITHHPPPLFEHPTMREFAKYADITRNTIQRRRNWYRTFFARLFPAELTIFTEGADRMVHLPYGGRMNTAIRFIHHLTDTDLYTLVNTNAFLEVPREFLITDVPPEVVPHHLCYDGFTHRWIGTLGTTSAFSFRVPCPLVFTTAENPERTIQLADYTVDWIIFRAPTRRVTMVFVQRDAFYPRIEVRFQYRRRGLIDAAGVIIDAIRIHCITANNAIHEINHCAPKHLDIFGRYK